VALTEPETMLYQNIPNPFFGQTQVNFELKEAGYTTLKVYNLLGQEVAVLFEGQAESGNVYETTMRSGQLARGLYYYTLTTGSERLSKKMVLE
jgi:extracellular elastinolytic metalloproteinase